MAIADSTLALGEVFLETADGSRISLGQLKAPISIHVKPVKEKAFEPIQIGSKVQISSDPKCVERTGSRDGWVDPEFKGKTGTIDAEPNERGDWPVRIDESPYTQLISPEHLTVVS
jgi:ribosomal protein L21E